MVHWDHLDCPFSQLHDLGWSTSTMDCPLWSSHTFFLVAWFTGTTCVVPSHNCMTLHGPCAPWTVLYGLLTHSSQLHGPLALPALSIHTIVWPCMVHLHHALPCYGSPPQSCQLHSPLAPPTLSLYTIVQPCMVHWHNSLPSIVPSYSLPSCTVHWHHPHCPFTQLHNLAWSTCTIDSFR